MLDHGINEYTNDFEELSTAAAKQHGLKKAMGNMKARFDSCRAWLRQIGRGLTPGCFGPKLVSYGCERLGEGLSSFLNSASLLRGRLDKMRLGRCSFNLRGARERAARRAG